MRLQTIPTKLCVASIFFFALFIHSAIVYGAGNATLDDSVTSEMLRRYKSLTREKIETHYKSGCDSSNMEWVNLCANYGFVSADMELNELYKKLKDNLQGTNAEKKLLQAQRAWIVFRDTSCAYESDAYATGRWLHPTTQSCKTAFTLKRNDQLKEYLKCTDPGCPGEW